MRQSTWYRFTPWATVFSTLLSFISAEVVDDQPQQEFTEVQGRVLSSAATLGVCALVFACLNLICCSVSLHKAIKDRERIKKRNAVRKRINAHLMEPKTKPYMDDGSPNPETRLQPPLEPTAHVKRLHAKSLERNIPEAQPLTRLPATQHSPAVARLARMDHTADITFTDPLSY
ncbi:unnamed protein product [Dicrocoelium dendriticum]|nr:unnamed protein product [Dicrocoelium dendriticum]